MYKVENAIVDLAALVIKFICIRNYMNIPVEFSAEFQFLIHNYDCGLKLEYFYNWILGHGFNT